MKDDGMKDVLYWLAYVLIILSIVIWSLGSLFSCTAPISQETEDLEIEHVDLDSLSHMADSAISDVHHTIDDLDNDVKIKDKRIRKQLIELKNMQELSEIKKQEALVEIERAKREKAQVDSLMVVLEKEFEEKWDAYDKELLLLERDIDLIVQQLNEAVEEMTIIVLQLGLEKMLYNRNTKISKLMNYLPSNKLDSLIANTPVLKLRTKKNKNGKID